MRQTLIAIASLVCLVAAALTIAQITSPGGITGNTLVLPTVTVATLPTCSASQKGLLFSVSDATAPTYNAALTGGGAVITPVFCNGTAWTSH